MDSHAADCEDISSFDLEALTFKQATCAFTRIYKKKGNPCSFRSSLKCRIDRRSYASPHQVGAAIQMIAVTVGLSITKANGAVFVIDR